MAQSSHRMGAGTLNPINYREIDLGLFSTCCLLRAGSVDMLPGTDRHSSYQLSPCGVRSIDVKGEVNEVVRPLISRGFRVLSLT